MASFKLNREREGIRAVKIAVSRSGVPRIVSFLSGPKRIVSVYYHEPDPDTFRRHAQWLVARYSPISIDLLHYAHQTGDATLLPKHPLLISIDDGWRSNTALVPIIKAFSLPVVIYVVAGLIGTRRKFWFRAVTEAGGNSGDYKYLPNQERLAKLRADYGYEADGEYDETSVLTWDDLRAMQRTSLITVGSHTLSHPILPRCTTEEACAEIIDSRRVLEEQLDCSVIHFSYPNGDFGEREVQILKNAGYVTGRKADGFFHGVGPKHDPYRINTLACLDAASITDLSLSSVGYDEVLRRVRSSFFFRRQG